MWRAVVARLRRAPAPPELEPLPAYDLWAASYPAEAGNPLMQAEEAAVRDLLPAAEVRGRRALDLACGTGRYLRWLAGAGAGLVVGLDFSGEMLARAQAGQPRLARADLRALPLQSGSFDVIVCGLAVGHLPDLGQALAEAARVLRPGGVVVYSDFHPSGARLGWRRTFRAGPREFVVRHHRHEYADHVRACAAAGLIIQAVREPFAVDEAGRRAWGDVPAALVVRAARAAARFDFAKGDKTMPVRKAEAVWTGTLKEGQGTMKFGDYEGAYTHASRFASGEGTNPEELVGAAHSGCFSMFLSALLTNAGFVPTRIHTTATVHLEEGPTIAKIELNTEVEVPNLDDATLQEKAAEAKIKCPVSKALAGVNISVNARLVS